MDCGKVKARKPQLLEKLENQCPNLSRLSLGLRLMNVPAAPAWAKANGPQTWKGIFFHLSNHFASCHPLNQSEIGPGKQRESSLKYADSLAPKTPLESTPRVLGSCTSLQQDQSPKGLFIPHKEHYLYGLRHSLSLSISALGTATSSASFGSCTIQLIV